MALCEQNVKLPNAYLCRMSRKLFFILPFFFLACNDDLPQQIPNVFVNEYVYLSNPSSQPINFIGGSIYHQGGYRGLVIYRRYMNGDSNDWAAYEQACPDHYSRDCGLLEVDDDIYLKCPCDDTRFLMFDGTVTEGESTYPVLQYKVNWQGDKLHITNN